MGHTRTITQSDPAEMLALDARLRLHFNTEIDRARNEAYKKGQTEGRADAIAATNQVATAIGLSTAQLMDFSERDREIAVAAVIELAQRIATLILSGTPHDAGLALLGQIRELLMDLDDAPFVVAVHPDDLDIVSAGVEGDSVTVAADPQLKPGEARIRGAWSYSDLTNSTAWESVLAALNQAPGT